jgi:hypothetical protein
MRRALARLEHGIHVRPEVEERWLARLWDRRDTLKLSESDEPTEEQVGALVRELWHAEADVKDARSAEKTLPSATALISPEVAAALCGADAEGEAALLRAGARTDVDTDDAGRATWDDVTEFWSAPPDDAHAKGGEAR